MKILKPGKVELRKFVCPNCGCVFAAGVGDLASDLELVRCPQDGCRYAQQWRYDGEPYEEPTQDVQSDALRLYKLLKGTWPYSIGELEVLSTFLADNGVTFREE